MSLMDDFAALGKLIGRDLEADLKRYAPYGRCDVCGTELEYEPPFKGAHDEWPRAGGFWCTECEAWS